ncbi:MAG: hypothetical protein C4529_13420 [Deltaproteobacteria bacterium]|nr:MAG: hypothetical protein C4529_13420 [Deltaproteobacteria bacterium]
MRWNRWIGVLLVAVMVVPAMSAFAEPDAELRIARRGADDAEEHGGRRGDHHDAATGRSPAGATPAASESPDPGGKALFDVKCSTCHALARPLGKNKDRDGWTTTVTRMQKVNGCAITDAEAKAIVDYLVQVRGPAGK